MNQTQLYLDIAIWSQAISSVVFIGALVYMWFRWLMPVFLAAQERSNRQIAEAERHRDEVKGALEALREEIGTARHDAELIEQRAADQAEHERQAALAEATDAGERALHNAQGELNRARVAAQARLRDELLEQALRLARDDAAKRINAAVSGRLIDRFIAGLSLPEVHASNAARGKG